MSIQRWDISGYEWEQDPHPEGDWVLFSDHVAAVAEAQANLDHVSYVLGQTSERQRSVLLIADAYAAGVQAARDAVAEVEHIGYYAEEVRDAALAAIDALTE